MSFSPKASVASVSPKKSGSDVFHVLLVEGRHSQPEVNASGDYVRDEGGRPVQKDYTSGDTFYAKTDLSNGGNDLKFKLLS